MTNIEKISEFVLRFKKYLLKFVFKLHIFRGSGVYVIIYKLIINRDYKL